MKNKKIISLTIIIVAVVLIGVLGLSRFFENTWQNENTADNSLDVDITDNTESVFNYPYVDIDTAIEDGCLTAINIKESIDKQKDIPNEDMITYQDAVNKAGEDIKYLTGFTGHTITPVFAQYISDDVLDEFYLIRSYKKPDVIGSDKVISFEAWIDAYTGEYLHIVIGYDFSKAIAGNLKSIPTQTEHIEKAQKYIEEVFSVLNVDYDIETTGAMVREYKNYKQYSSMISNWIVRCYEIDDTGVFYPSYIENITEVS